MVLTSPKKTHLESALSLFLLLILASIALGILIRQSKTDLSRFGMDFKAANTPLLSPTTIKHQKSIIDSVVPEYFSTQAASETYDADNLYEKIDGKAPLYIDSGFVELNALRYISKNDENLWMEIEVFDMANPRNAFSIFSVQRRAEAVILKDQNPKYEYGTDNALFFITGKYYIEIVGSAKSDILLAGMIDLTNKLKQKLTVDPVIDMVELSLFPGKDIVSGSKKLYLKNVFGFDGLNDVFVCRYKVNETNITAYLARYDDIATAKSKADNYYKFLKENGGKDKTSTNKILNDNQVKVVDFYGTTEIVFTTGRFIGGIHESDNQQKAEDLAAELFEKLRQQAPTE
jgi:hypothetical protein